MAYILGQGKCVLQSQFLVLFFFQKVDWTRETEPVYKETTGSLQCSRQHTNAKNLIFRHICMDSEIFEDVFSMIKV